MVVNSRAVANHYNQTPCLEHVFWDVGGGGGGEKL